VLRFTHEKYPRSPPGTCARHGVAALRVTCHQLLAARPTNRIIGCFAAAVLPATQAGLGFLAGGFFATGGGGGGSLPALDRDQTAADELIDAGTLRDRAAHIGQGARRWPGCGLISTDLRLAERTAPPRIRSSQGRYRKAPPRAPPQRRRTGLGHRPDRSVSDRSIIGYRPRKGRRVGRHEGRSDRASGSSQGPAIMFWIDPQAAAPSASAATTVPRKQRASNLPQRQAHPRSPARLHDPTVILHPVQPDIASS